MTSPRSTPGGGYYRSTPYAETPIYDSLVAERGTPQIAPIRVPPAYDTGNHLAALPAALPPGPSHQTPPPGYQGYQTAPPALPSGPSHHIPPHGYPQAAAQQFPARPPLQQAPGPHVVQHTPPPAPYLPQHMPAPRGYGYPPQQQPVRPAAPRPAAPPRQAPGPYDDPYGRQHPGSGY